MPRLLFALLFLALAVSAEAQTSGSSNPVAAWDNTLIYPIAGDVAGDDGGGLEALTQELLSDEFAALGISAIQLPMLATMERGGVADYTTIDRRWGSAESLRAFVKAAHDQGIRVIMEVNLNETAPPPTGYSLSDSVATWWDSGWIRADVDGYESCGVEPTTACVPGRADFRTEVGSPVGLPEFLQTRWGESATLSEQSELDDFFARTRHPRTPRFYMIKWLSDWVRDFGIDGFYAVGVDGVDVGLWSALKQEAVTARADWAGQSGEATTVLGGFWLGGDADPLGETATELYAQGFDVMQHEISTLPAHHNVLDSLYAVQSDSVVANPAIGLVSQLSQQLLDGDAVATHGVHALLMPGSVRLPETFDSDLLAENAVLNKVAAFRRRHDAIGAGTHVAIATNPYIFQRSLMIGATSDNVVVALNAEGRTRINVSSAFPDDAIVRDVITGKTGFVSFGYVSFTPDESGLLLLEEVR